MLSNADIKRIRSLSEKKYRDRFSQFVVEGEKMVDEALKSDFEVLEVYRSEEIGNEKMSRISLLSSPSPALAVLKKPALDGAVKLNKGLYLALDSIRDPGNLGTIIRVADWFGIDGIFASPDTVDLFNPKTVQSTMGAIFRCKVHVCNIPSLCTSVIENSGRVYGTFLDGENIWHKELSTGEDSPSLIVIGNEANGISSEVASLVSDRLFIPPYPADDPGSESLNAAVATAITLAEFTRRRS